MQDLGWPDFLQGESMLIEIITDGRLDLDHHRRLLNRIAETLKQPTEGI
ncbi:MAG: hypothetical protein R3C44_06535 [Chloroflexota bacterium]